MKGQAKKWKKTFSNYIANKSHIPYINIKWILTTQNVKECKKDSYNSKIWKIDFKMDKNLHTNQQ